MTTTLEAPAARAPAQPRGVAGHALRRGLALVRASREVTVLVIDDDAMARSWLRLSLWHSEFQLVGEAATAREGVALAAAIHPDLLLVDVTLPDSSGLDLVRGLRERGVTAPAVVATTVIEPGFNEAAFSAGAQGTLLKTGSATEVLDALRSVRTGTAAFDVRHPRRTSGPMLTPRERDVLVLVAQGATNAEIAAELGVGIETVKTLLRRAFARLGVQRRVQAVSAARDLGLV